MKCTCGIIGCVCKLIAGHASDCRFRVSCLCPVSVECEHGFDVCVKCDACTCAQIASDLQADADAQRAEHDAEMVRGLHRPALDAPRMLADYEARRR